MHGSGLTLPPPGPQPQSLLLRPACAPPRAPSARACSCTASRGSGRGPCCSAARATAGLGSAHFSETRCRLSDSLEYQLAHATPACRSVPQTSQPPPTSGPPRSQALPQSSHATHSPLYTSSRRGSAVRSSCSPGSTCGSAASSLRREQQQRLELYFFPICVRSSGGIQLCAGCRQAQQAAGCQRSACGLPPARSRPPPCTDLSICRRQSGSLLEAQQGQRGLAEPVPGVPHASPVLGLAWIQLRRIVSRLLSPAGRPPQHQRMQSDVRCCRWLGAYKSLLPRSGAARHRLPQQQPRYQRRAAALQHKKSGPAHSLYRSRRSSARLRLACSSGSPSMWARPRP